VVAFLAIDGLRAAPITRLIRHRDRVVTKQELLTHLWPQQFVSDSALSYCIRAARKAVGDSGRGQRVIKTLYERGYRFVAAVEVCIEDTADRGGAVAVEVPIDARAQAQAPGGSVTREGGVAERREDERAGEAPWEPKPVTVLAIDVSWPQVTDRDAPCEVPWTTIRQWQQAVVDKVQGFGALIIQQVPSPLMAVFGMPRTMEQMPQRAVQAALALRQLMADGGVSDGESPCPEVRMAIHTGHVLVDVHASDPREQLLTIGDTLSRPVRMLGHAVPGDILLSSQVAGLVEGWFELRAREGASETGTANGLRTYAVVGLGPRRSSLEVYGKRPLSRFVGRERELAELHDRLARVEKGRGQIVSIMGEPGVGKSRLCYEVSRSPRTHGWLILESSPVAYGKDIPYFPVVDLLKFYFLLDAGDEPRILHDKITTKLQTLDEGLRPIVPPVLALLDLPVEDPPWQALEPSQRRQLTLDALKRLLVRESQIRPVLLIVENLHWIDTETQAFLDGLVNSLPTARLLLLVNYRPEYQHRWGSKTYYRPLRLDPLGPERAADLLRSLIGEDPTLAPLNQHLIERTEGNPFFLEESVRTLVEAQVLVGAPGAYRLAHAVQNLRVPATVQAVLASRIDLLAPEDKRLLQMAAVIGTEVPLALLQALAEQDDERLRTGLSHLQAAEFLYETRLFPELTYTFKHALTHEVAYGSLLQERRRALHARIVEALEALAWERVAEPVERLAYHALRGELWDKALAYGRQAGEAAMARSAHREAVSYFEQALSALPHLADDRDARVRAIDLRLALRSALRALGDFGRTLAHLREAESLAAALDDPRRLGLISLFLSQHFRMMGTHDQAVAAAQRALVLATAGGDGVLHALANQYLGFAYEVQGDYRRAIDCMRQTVTSLEGAGRHERFGQIQLPAVNSRVHLAACHAELGMFTEGRVFADEGLRIAKAVAHPASLITAYWGVGLLALGQGDLPRALPALEWAVGMCQNQEADQPVRFPRIAEALGAAYTLAGRVADAVPLLMQALEQMMAMDVSEDQVCCRLSLAEAQLLAGHLEEAHALAERALALARALHERGHQAWALWLLGEIAVHHAPPQAEQAETHYREALARAGELGMCPLQAHGHLGLGTLYVKTGQYERARTELSVAINLYRAMDMTFWLPQAEAMLARGEEV
jgi:tetratricopeptide (TPR) repeat protein